MPGTSFWLNHLMIKYAPTPHSHMNAAANVVTKSVGSSMIRPMPTQMTINTAAPRTPIRRAAIRAKTTTVIVKIMKRPRGNEESAS